MGPPTDPGPSGSARVSKWSVRPWSTDDQCALMICVAPAVPPGSVHQCQLLVLIHSTCQCHISATFQCSSVPYQCPSELPFSVTHQCPLSVPVSAAYQCGSVPPISAQQCCLSVPPNSASQCHLSVPDSGAYQCCLSMPYMSAAFQCPSVMPVNAHQ
ncbi:unnamed protein product [Staurois parvus]|uniref:Uncharacterized protein n=1 Tax=Staurois parvus TaxID=386267 RepID=A0ABN9DAU4_9NEOB|nr:unnamed protein product [Staurois parvus]